MKLVSRNSMGGIRAASYISQSVSDIQFKEYDVVLITSSWDNRCLSLIDSELPRAENCILLFFDDKDSKGFRDSNDAKILNFAKSNFENIFIINGLSTDIDKVWDSIRGILYSIYRSNSRPLSILYDFSASPRYYGLTLLSECNRSGLARDIGFFYRECSYPKVEDELSFSEVAFTEGKWTPRVIEFMNGSIDSGAINCFIASLGFEGSKTLRILNEFEPDLVYVILPDPGFSPDYIVRVRNANSELLLGYGVSADDELSAAAGDSIAVWKILAEQFKRGDDHNYYLLCAGSKPHSLGLALAAATLKFPALLYSLPERHVPVDVVPAATCWLYEIENLIVPLVEK